MMNSNVLEALVSIQAQLKSPKDQNAGRYRYRNIEDINQAVKPLAAAQGCAVVYSDEFREGLCISTCTLMAPDGKLSATGITLVNLSPKNMSIEQSFGAASSYARKYAACGLFAIDSSENDPDRTNAKAEDKRKPKKDASDAAKALWDAEKKAFELMGYASPKEFHEQAIAVRSDWSAEPETMRRIANEILEQIGEK